MGLTEFSVIVECVAVGLTELSVIVECVAVGLTEPAVAVPLAVDRLVNLFCGRWNRFSRFGSAMITADLRLGDRCSSHPGIIA